MTDDEMASVLRAAGWVCVPPLVDPRIPHPKVGQIWDSPNPLSPRRVVARLSQFGHSVGFWAGMWVPEDHRPNQSVSLMTWLRWAERTGARPIGTMTIRN